MEQWYWYERLPEGGIKLLRIFGSDSDIIIPENVAAGQVVEIGEYCFAEKQRAGNYHICSETEELAQDCMDMAEQSGIFPATGGNVSRVALPDSIKKIGNYAFYQCQNLEEIRLKTGIVDVGSDAFMNCRRLSAICFRGNPAEASCLKQILAQRSEETMVCFLEGGEIQAMLLYPEYSEHYDLIGPAHIFELNIQGEGFRARQCFQNGVVDFGAYDRIFSLECGEESMDTLCRMACSRLQYPWKLQERERQLYEDYVAGNITTVCHNLVKEKNFEGVRTLYQSGLLASGAMQDCLEEAAAAGWTEGVRQIFSLKEGDEKEGDDYAFQDF